MLSFHFLKLIINFRGAGTNVLEQITALFPNQAPTPAPSSCWMLVGAPWESELPPSASSSWDSDIRNNGLVTKQRLRDGVQAAPLERASVEVAFEQRRREGPQESTARGACVMESPLCRGKLMFPQQTLEEEVHPNHSR